MHCVYILISKTDPSKYYVGITQDIKKRLTGHNENPSCSYTAKHKPWNLSTFISFGDEKKAANFEIYLKAHSGKAFLKKHLIYQFPTAPKQRPLKMKKLRNRQK